MEPRGSVLFGEEPGDFFPFGAGATANMPVPKNVDFELIDTHISVPDVEAFSLIRSLARMRGLLLGPTSGAAICAALPFANSLPIDSQIVVLAPDGGEKYLSTIFDDDWMRNHDLLNDAIAAHAESAFACPP